MPERKKSKETKTKSDKRDWKRRPDVKRADPEESSVDTTTAVLMGLAAAANSFLFGIAPYAHGALEVLTGQMDQAIRQHTGEKLSIHDLAALTAALPLLYYIAAKLLPSRGRRFRLGKRNVSFSDLSERMIITLNPRRRRSNHSNGRAMMRRPNLRRAKLQQRFLQWGLTLRQLDPRLQIFQFFTEIAAVGASKRLESCKIHTVGHCTHNCLGRKGGKGKNKKRTSLLHLPSQANLNPARPRLSAAQFTLANGCFDQASVFTVWRPTSQDAIRKMMSGEAIGKGLDIKGKSAKKGKLSALVPVLQIHSEGEKHKNMLRHIPKEARMRLYFQSRKARTLARTEMEVLADEMVAGYAEAERMVQKQTKLEEMFGDLATPMPDDLWDQALNRKYKWQMSDPTITVLVPIGEDRFGLELPQRLFVEAYIIQGDIYRKPNSPDDTGRASIPMFQDMNLETLRKQTAVPKNKKQQQHPLPPRPVAYQSNPDPHKALDPKDLVMAYEEDGRVMPVVSDFDCFLVGTRRVTYRHALPPEQVKMMSWCIDTIEQVLDDVKAQPAEKRQDATWTGQWLERLKKERTENNFKPTTPKYGFADPKSYAIMSHAVHTLKGNGCVRHGAECFNYYFPQDLDEYFLVVSYDIRNGGNRWDTFTEDELLGFLSQKVSEGFMFPLNPKWILCDDSGWKRLYDKQIRSTSPSVKQSVDAWYPPSSGIRERLEEVHMKYPTGFDFPDETGGMKGSFNSYKRQLSFSIMRNGMTLSEGDEDLGMDYALMTVDNHEKVQKAKIVFHVIIAVNRLKTMVKRRKELEAMRVRGGSLVKGSLPPKKNVLRVRVPKEALPNGYRSNKNGLGDKSSSFTINALKQVPLLRSLSFDRWSPQKTKAPAANAPATIEKSQPGRSGSHDSVVPNRMPRRKYNFNNNDNNNASQPARTGSHGTHDLSNSNNFSTPPSKKQPVQAAQRHTASKTRYY